MKFKRGFSLIELLMFLAVISIISYGSLSSLMNLNAKIHEIGLDFISNELLNDMRYSQQKAMEEGQIYHIYFDSVKNSYMIYHFYNAKSIIYKNTKLPSYVCFDSTRSTYDDNMISFNSNGKPLPHPCTVALMDDYGHIRKITINIGTDLIELKDF